MTPFFAAPSGGIRFGKRLFAKPKVRVIKANSPARILFITDLHLRPSHSEMARITFESARDTAPDIVCLGGDMAEFDEGLYIAMKELRRVFPNIPVFAVPGNNDDLRFGGDRREQALFYQKYDCNYLLNSASTVSVSGKEMCIAGVEDAYTHIPDAEGLISRDCYSVLLTHAPHRKLFLQQPNLLLSGHTHGGQINVLGFNCYGLMKYEGRFDLALLSGTKKIGNTLTVVSRGIGWSKYPVRIGADSEIHLIV